MKKFLVREVGAQWVLEVEAHNDYHAVAEVAQCAVNDVTLPIWEEFVKWKWSPRGKRCYMPLDNSGRQWIVEDVRSTF